MARYHRAVGSRYEAFLSEFSADTPDELHHLILTAMIAGSFAAAHTRPSLSNRSISSAE